MTDPTTTLAHHHFDLLLLDAIGLTADPRRPELRDCAIGIRDGRIAWLDRQPPERFTAQRTLRLPGHFVTPGFVNPHTHSVRTMVRGVAADLGFAPSYTPGIPKGAAVTPALRAWRTATGTTTRPSAGERGTPGSRCTCTGPARGNRQPRGWQGRRPVGVRRQPAAPASAREPAGNLVHTGQGRDVHVVMVAGDILVEHGRPTKVDMDLVCAEAEAAARAPWGAEGKPYWR
ncbi:hypothetical protein [Variovorax paradoxus]|uniref:5-methylthioadenosine/S-adenosylhomocysteine deaminase n=1 Tax=Variovorax paradoxus TaxID=34073 RepID=A0A0H2LP45_VARPD|nr:hypothetical protein [Variovorax paradoxus]KLN52054.1 5-methylthioadenosine/S-adenosylhomocysteine deaminase [Variovorax paradoxus]